MEHCHVGLVPNLAHLWDGGRGCLDSYSSNWFMEFEGSQIKGRRRPFFFFFFSFFSYFSCSALPSPVLVCPYVCLCVCLSLSLSLSLRHNLPPHLIGIDKAVVLRVKVMLGAILLLEFIDGYPPLGAELHVPSACGREGGVGGGGAQQEGAGSQGGLASCCCSSS